VNVTLMSASEITPSFAATLPDKLREVLGSGVVTSRQVIALTAIRTCYSANKPSEVVALEYAKYFNKPASDGDSGTDADRLFRHIVKSGHTSTLEHITYTFAIEGVSRSLLAQLTRHRQFSFSVQSQRYVKFGSGDKSGGFDYVVPPSLEGKSASPLACDTAEQVFERAMSWAQTYYDILRKAGVPAEDARYVLPNAAATNLVMTGNLRAILEFYGKRRKGRGAQWEIADLAEKMREEITKVDGWTSPFFEEA
jgi:thymidylate synthase (FAD)